jgi:hypothetical protein
MVAVSSFESFQVLARPPWRIMAYLNILDAMWLSRRACDKHGSAASCTSGKRDTLPSVHAEHNVTSFLLALCSVRACRVALTRYNNYLVAWSPLDSLEHVQAREETTALQLDACSKAIESLSEVYRRLTGDTIVTPILSPVSLANAPLTREKVFRHLCVDDSVTFARLSKLVTLFLRLVGHLAGLVSHRDISHTVTCIRSHLGLTSPCITLMLDTYLAAPALNTGACYTVRTVELVSHGASITRPSATHRYVQQRHSRQVGVTVIASDVRTARHGA